MANEAENLLEYARFCNAILKEMKDNDPHKKEYEFIVQSMAGSAARLAKFVINCGTPT